MDAPDRPAATPETRPAAPWYLRVVPATLLVVVVVGTAVLVVPGLGDELRLSTSRQPADVVELYFDQPMGDSARAACLRRGASVRVRFVVASHLGERLAVPYRVELHPLRQGPRTRRQAGEAVVPPGRAVVVTAKVGFPADHGFVARVVLPSLDQQLRLRCPAVTR